MTGLVAVLALLLMTAGGLLGSLPRATDRDFGFAIFFVVAGFLAMLALRFLA